MLLAVLGLVRELVGASGVQGTHRVHDGVEVLHVLDLGDAQHGDHDAGRVAKSEERKRERGWHRSRTLLDKGKGKKRAREGVVAYTIATAMKKKVRSREQNLSSMPWPDDSSLKRTVVNPRSGLFGASLGNPKKSVRGRTTGGAESGKD